MLRASRLNIKNSPLQVLQVFRLFTTRRNCRAFWLLHSVYRLGKLTTLACIVFEWLKRIEPKSTTFNYPRISSKSMHPWASAEIFQRGATSKFCLSFSGCWRRNANGRSQNSLPYLYPISLCWLNLNSQYFVWNVFYNSAIRNAFSFHKLPNIHFFKHFLQISRILRIINQRPEQHERRKKNKKLTLSQNCFKPWKVERNVDKTIRQITTVGTPRRRKALSRWITKILHSKNIALQFALSAH